MAFNHRLWLILFLLGTSCFARRQSGPEVVISDNPFGVIALPNAWICSTIAWAETLLLRRMGEKKNLSEAYLSYRHFEDQLLSGRKKLDPSGNFQRARELISKFGLMKDDDFLPKLSDAERNDRQAQAFNYLSTSILTGLLRTDRKPAIVRAELFKAFGLQDRPEMLKSKILWPAKIKVGKTLTLARELERAQEIMLENRLITPKILPKFSKIYSRSDFALMRKVIRNLNQGYPVIANWTAEFEALNDDGTFSLDMIKQPGRQLMRSSIIEAYAAEGPDNTGKAFIVREGSSDRTAQGLAATRGELTAIVVRNDWTGTEAPYKAGSFMFNGQKVNRLLASYAFGYFWQTEDGKKTAAAIRGLKSVIVAGNI